MSVVKYVSIQCDGVDVDNGVSICCDANLDTAITVASEARRHVWRTHQWITRDGKDYCPKHRSQA